MTDSDTLWLQPFLQAGEQVIATRKVAGAGELGAQMGVGSVAGAAGGAVGGAIAAAVMHFGRKSKQEPSKTPQTLAKVGVVAVTDARVLLIETGRLNNPRSVTADFPLDQVRSIRAEKAKVAFGKLILELDDRTLLFDLRSDRGLDTFVADANSALAPRAPESHERSR